MQDMKNLGNRSDRDWAWWQKKSYLGITRNTWMFVIILGAVGIYCWLFLDFDYVLGKR